MGFLLFNSHSLSNRQKATAKKTTEVDGICSKVFITNWSWWIGLSRWEGRSQCKVPGPSGSWRRPRLGLLSRASFNIGAAWYGRGQGGGVWAGMAPLLSGCLCQLDIWIAQEGGAELVGCPPTPSLAESLSTTSRARRRGWRLVWCWACHHHFVTWSCAPLMGRRSHGGGAQKCFSQGPTWLSAARLVDSCHCYSLQ